MQSVNGKIREFLLVLSVCVLAYSSLPMVQSDPKLESAYELAHVTLISRARLRAEEDYAEQPAPTEAASPVAVAGQGEGPSRVPAGSADDVTHH
jgi:hypothetical protein